MGHLLMGLSSLLGALLLISHAELPLQAQGRRAPALPASKPTIYDPDPLTCQPATIREAFERQLEPYASQSPTVLAQLRKVQLDMTRSSLQRCVSKGLMDRETASALWTELVSAQTTGSTRP
ncbi:MULTISPECIES: hypothetical protein [Aphanothece]|uniref:hypothetical protein n=1 Tax=Aphanothece TaxID=1121 RepID=UPI003985651E